MASELGVAFVHAGQGYFQLRDRNNAIYNSVTGTFVNYTTGSYSGFAIASSEQGTASAFFVANMPAGIPAGTYSVYFKSQPGANPSETDPTISFYQMEWNGIAAAPRSDNSTSGQLSSFMPLRLARRQQVLNYPIYLRSAANSINGFTSGIVSGQIAKDGGTFTALQSGAFTECGLGGYWLQALTSGDTDARTILLQFTAAGVSGGSAVPLVQAFITQPVSGG